MENLRDELVDFLVNQCGKIGPKIELIIETLLDVIDKLKSCDRRVLIAIIACVNVIIISSIISNKLEIKRAEEKLYIVTGADRDQISYAYSPRDNFINNGKIKMNYYIFKNKSVGTNKNTRIFAIDKKTFNIYICIEGETLIPYCDYIYDTETVAN